MTKTKMILVKIEPKEAAKTSQLYTPFYESCLDLSKTLSVGQQVAGNVSGKSSRNVEFHKKYFAVVRLVYHNLPDRLAAAYPAVDNLHEAIKWECGIFKTVQHLNGEITQEVGSISFDKMTPGEFAEFFHKAVEVAMSVIGIDRDAVMREIAGFM